MTSSTIRGNFPIELFFPICEHLAWRSHGSNAPSKEARKTLTSLARTCKVLQRAAETALYHTIVLPTQPEVFACCEALPDIPRLSCLVKVLVIGRVRRLFTKKREIEATVLEGGQGTRDRDGHGRESEIVNGNLPILIRDPTEAASAPFLNELIYAADWHFQSTHWSRLARLLASCNQLEELYIEDGRNERLAGTVLGSGLLGWDRSGDEKFRGGVKEMEEELQRCGRYGGTIGRRVVNQSLRVLRCSFTIDVDFARVLGGLDNLVEFTWTGTTFGHVLSAVEGETDRRVLGDTIGKRLRALLPASTRLGALRRLNTSSEILPGGLVPGRGSVVHRLVDYS